MFQRVGPAALKKDLTNIIKLCDALDNPYKQFKTIHIAGTNGKGSVAHILASILQESGQKVGLYTSPHYKDFRERIKINAQYITEEFVSSFVSDNKSLFEDIQPSFFEITVAMAFSYFEKQEVDIAIIETGLGGRLDSTNIITPILSVITNIGYDHQQFLGDTLESIATEKAGIIKKDVPVIIGERHEETQLVFEHKAKNENAPIHFAEDKFKVENYFLETLTTVFDVYYENKIVFYAQKSDLRGKYQKKNIITALAAVNILKNQLKIDDNNIRLGLENVISNTRFIGRFQVINEKPLTIADSAHNEQGLTALFKELKSIQFDKLHIIYGTVADKELDKVLPILPKQAMYYFCKPNVVRGLNESELAQEASNYNLNGNHYPSVDAAHTEAKQQASDKDLVLIAGSIFVVAEVI